MKYKDWIDKLKNWFDNFGGIITIASVVCNILQYSWSRSDKETLRSRAQAEYNVNFMIARACTRAKNAKLDSSNADVNYLLREMSYINGIADIARNDVVAFGREQLAFVPFFEHPAYPGVEQPKEIKLGLPPERFKHDNNQQDSIRKMTP